MTVPPDLGFRKNARAVLALGLPLIGSQVAQFALHVTDTIMLGWYSVTDLAAGALGATMFFVMFTVGMGYGLAVMPMVASSAASGDETEVRRVTRMGMWLSLAYAALVLPLFLFAEPILLALGQEPDVAHIAGAYLLIVGFGMGPALIVMVLKSYLAGLGKTQVAMWITVAGVGVNVACNWLFIFGNLGAPELGARGAAIASLVVQIFTMLLLLAYAVWLPELRKFQLLVRFWKPDWAALRRVNALGLPIGMALLSEAGLFSASAIMMGWLGTQQLAAHSIALEITAVFFMVHIGLGNAATVLVGGAHGRANKDELRAAAKASLALSLTFAIVTVGVYFLFAEQLVGLFLSPNEPQRDVIISTGVSLLMVAAFFQLADGGQAMGMSLLRGVQDTRAPMFIAAVAYWIIGLPAGYGLGFIAGWGGEGIWMGLVVGLTAAAIALHARFWRGIGAR